MKHYVKEWRKARKLNQEQLAEMADTSTVSISRIENGKQGLTGERITLIAEALGITPGALYQAPPEGTNAEENGKNVGGLTLKHTKTNIDVISRDKLVSEQSDLPIYASAQGGATGMTVDLTSPIEWAKRPEPLFNVPNGFGMYVVGDSMEPAYKQGDMILVHPNKPANSGDDILIIKANGESEHAALVKTLVRTNDSDIHFKQYNPPQELSLPKAQIQNIFLIVGKYNRR